jgi:hypothetical protein
MCGALTEATAAVSEFIGRFPGAYPPLIINISDGKPTDGHPELPASKLRNMTTTDGNVLIFNAHLSSEPARPIEFPSQESELPDHGDEKWQVILSRHFSPSAKPSGKMN